jgi:FkbM family methyltransferase
MYWLMRDKSKKLYTPNTFFAASALNRSFVHGTCRFPGDKFLPGRGGVIIEAGAYVGYKAISFAQRVGPSGKVIVIEASPGNFHLLSKSIDENGFGDVAFPINCAVWNKDEQLSLMSRSRMKHTVVNTDELPFEANDTINAKSLDTIIDDFDLEYVDFLNLQLNGAEVEAIEGLSKHFHRVRYINIVSRHHRNGALVVDRVRQMLEDRGCEIIVDCRTNRLCNLTAKVMP